MIEGWLAPGTKRMLASHLNANTKNVIELGSWKGLSSVFIAGVAPNAKIYCVDHWQGSEEHQSNPDLLTLYETFSENVKEHKNIVPVKESTAQGMVTLALKKINPDVIFVDADHSYFGCKTDVLIALGFWPNVQVVGDDWSWPGVRQAALEIARAFGKSVYFDGNGWCFGAKNYLRDIAANLCHILYGNRLPLDNQEKKKNEWVKEFMTWWGGRPY